MRGGDLIGFATGAVRAHRQRSLLTVLGIAVGIATVVLLTALGEGVRQFVLGEFTQFGTNLLGVFPGKTSTFGGSPGTISTTRPLSLADAGAIERLPLVEGVVPMIQGNASVETGERSRRTIVFGVSGQVPRVWRADVAFGRFLPDTSLDEARSFAVLGAKMHRELFRGENPLGARVRIGADSFRVIGVMEPKGQMLGFDLDDTLFIPVARAQQVFNREGLMEIDVLFRAGERSTRVAAGITRLLIARHGQEDFSITTQDKMLEVLGSIIGILTAGVAAIGVLSLVFPALPLRIAWPYAGAALGLSVGIGMVAGLLPAARAAGLDPIAALREE